MQNAVLERFAENDRPNVKRWLNLAGALIWDSASWTFKKGEATLTSTVGDNNLTGEPSDLGAVVGIWTIRGERLAYYAPAAFHDFYRESLATGVQASPESYTVSSVGLQVGPLAAANENLFLLYEKHYTNLSGDSDVSAIPPAYHWVQVAAAMSIGQSNQQDPTGSLQDNVVAQGIASMRREYLVAVKDAPEFWGATYAGG